MLALASSEAPAQATAQATSPAASPAVAQAAPQGPLALDVKAAVAQTLPAVAPNSAYRTATAAPSGAALQGPTTTALYSTRPAQSVTVALPSSAAPAMVGGAAAAAPSAPFSQAAPAIAREATWLYRNGWPLYALVDRYGAGAPLDEQANCIAVAVYFEARGEALEGQLAVARVIMNRAASGKYPGSWCSVVKQPWQFSFVRSGLFPHVDRNSAAWRNAQAITRLAVANVVPSLSNDVLWYHADYVAPSWGRRLSFVQKIGTHIFYRA